MSTSVAAVRQAIAAALTAIPDWRELSRPYELVRSDPKTWSHQGFAVGAPWTEDQAVKQRPAGSEDFSEFRVFWTWKLKVGVGPIQSYDAALDAEQLLYAALLGIRRGTHWRLVLGRRQRTCGDTWVTGEITVTAEHQTV
jgi:hypothetical protein